MINTQEKVKLANTKLITNNKLDIMKFVNDNLNSMMHWLTTNSTCTEHHSFQDRIGMNTHGHIVINESTYGIDNTVFAIKPQRSMEQGNLSIKDWAIKLLTNYAKWYNKLYVKQRTMSLTDIAYMLTRHPENAVFNKRTYQDFIVNNLDRLNSTQFTNQYMDDVNIFYKQLLVNYSAYPQLYTSTLSYLIRWITSKDDTSETNILINYIYKTLILKDKDMPKEVFDIDETSISLYTESIYKLITKLSKTISSHIVLPLSGIFTRDSVYQYCHIEYHCISQQDLNNFITILTEYINVSLYADEAKDYQNTIKNDNVSIVLGEYRTDFVNKIKSLHNFAGISSFNKLSVLLQQLLDKANAN